MIGFQNLVILDNSIIKSMVSLLRDKKCLNDDFRKIAKRLSVFLCYESCKNLGLNSYELETPMSKAIGYTPSAPVSVIAVLRAGLGMVNGVLECIPNAGVGCIGMYRNEETLKPVQYYCKLPKNISKSNVLIVDPMLATGGSACDAINIVKSSGAKSITLLSLISAPEGVKYLNDTHPDVSIYTTSLDSNLNDRGYIVPGLGDAGDRMFGTDID